MYKFDNNRTLIIGFSISGKTFLMNNISSQKQGEVHIITRSRNQNPLKIKNTSDAIQPLDEYENSTVVIDKMLLSKQESNIGLFFTRWQHNIIDIFTIFLKVLFIYQKVLFVLFLKNYFI